MVGLPLQVLDVLRAAHVGVAGTFIDGRFVDIELEPGDIGDGSWSLPEGMHIEIFDVLEGPMQVVDSGVVGPAIRVALPSVADLVPLLKNFPH